MISSNCEMCPELWSSLSSEKLVSQLVSRCFEPSQPQRITSGLNTNFTLSPSQSFHHHHHYHHQSLNRESRWDTTDDFATSFLHFSLFSTALWDLPNCRPVPSLMLSSHLFPCLSCLLPPFTVPCKMLLARPDERETYSHHCSLCLLQLSDSLSSYS